MAKDMTQGKPSKILIVFAMSILATSILDYVYSATDSAMLGHFVDKHALGAISSIVPAITLIQGVLLGLLSGFSITISRAFGSSDKEKIKKVIANAIFLAIVIIVPSMLISFFLVRPIAAAMNVPDEFLNDAVSYFSIIILALPISGTSWFCGGLFRAYGDSRTPMIISALCGVLNVFFNYIFLAVIPLGVAGAAIGTVCAAALGAIAYVILMIRKIPEVRSLFSVIRPKAYIVKELLNDGIAIALMNFVVNAGQVLIQRAINNFAPSVITGVSSGSKIVNFLWNIALSLESALMYFCSQNDGAGRIDRIKQGIKANLIITTIAGVVCVGVMVIFREPLIRIFIGNGVDLDTTQTLYYGSIYLLTQVAFLPAIILMSSFRGTVRGLGSSIPTVACGIIELICRAVVMVICEFSGFAQNVKINILYLAGPAAWIGAVILLGISIPMILKRKQNKIALKQSL